jgi:Rhs element Vgr protein
MPTSPRIDAEGVLRVTVKANGKALPQTVRLLSLRIRCAVNAIPSARIVIEDGDVASQSFEVADGETLKPGTEVAIALGYGDKEDTVFEGVVVRFGVKIGAHGSQLVLECHDKAVAMTLGRRQRVFIDQTDSDIVASLVTEYGLSADAAATDVTHGQLVQHDCSDWDFMLARAEASGCVVVVSGGKVSVKPPQTDGEPALKVSYGTDLIAFDADIDARTQVTTVKTLSWDPKTQQALTASVSPQSLGLQGNLDGAELAQVLPQADCTLRTSAPQEQAVLTQWARARQLKAELARVRGRLEFQGSALAVAGGLLEVAGVGTRFDGKVYAGAVQHDVHDGNWTTEVDIGLAPEWRVTRADVVAPLAGALVPGLQGLQVAVVTKLHADPNGAHRIQVRTPALEAGTELVWARLLMPYASSAFGAVFVPEIGDEVLVGHLAGDPAHPVVLGSMYSARHAPPTPLDADNKIKTLVTRCKHRLEFDDDRKIVTLTTPAGNKLVLDDEGRKITLKDQTGNEIEMSESGIRLDSAKDILISAKGKVTVSAVGAIALESTADVKASGLNVQCEAQVGFTGKGNASAELSASGQTTVKGAMVMIN